MPAPGPAAPAFIRLWYYHTQNEEAAPAMTQHSTPANSGVEANVARPGGVSYLRIPAHDLAQSAEFYRAVFGWQVRGRPDAPSFSDGTLRAAAEHGAELVTPPYPEGNLRIATIRDPAGNVIGIWQAGPR